MNKDNLLITILGIALLPFTIFTVAAAMSMFAVAWVFGKPIRVTSAGKVVGYVRYFTFTPVSK